MRIARVNALVPEEKRTEAIPNCRSRQAIYGYAGIFRGRLMFVAKMVRV